MPDIDQLWTIMSFHDIEDIFRCNVLVSGIAAAAG